MSNRFIHLIYCPVTGVGIRPFRGQEWYAHRLNIFRQYTLNSLLNQVNRQFIIWLSFRPEERDNPLTLELKQYLQEQGVIAFMTFNGLCYWDDKFSGGWKEKLMNLARVVRMAYQEKDPSPIHTPIDFVRMLLTNQPPIHFGWGQALRALFTDKNGTLKNRLDSTLSDLRKNLDLTKFDWVYVTRIDSDDMFHQDLVSEVQAFPPFPGALTCRNGYVYDANTGKLAEWKPKTNPPFHTIIFPKEDFFDPARHLQYFRGFRSHEDIPTVFNSQNLKSGRYCVLIHQKHISTLWDHPFRGKEIVQDKEEILGNFGIGPGGEYFKMDGLKLTRALKDEQNLAIKEIIGDYLVYKSQNRTYEPETTKVIKENVKEGGVCVDVGASIGYMTMQLARQVGQSGHVYAFEPTDNQFPYLKANMDRNGYQDRVTCFNLAAWDKTEDKYVRRDSVTDSENDNRIQVNAGFTSPIKGVILDDVLPQKIDFIKMDIDGSEPKALRGLVKTFERNPQLKMIIEYYPKCLEELGNDPADMMAILDKYFTYKKVEGDYNDEYYNLICIRKNDSKKYGNQTHN